MQLASGCHPYFYGDHEITALIEAAAALPVPVITLTISTLIGLLAAREGLRRGELAALRVDDPDGRVLSIERAATASVIGPTKTYQPGSGDVGGNGSSMSGRARGRVADSPAGGD